MLSEYIFININMYFIFSCRSLTIQQFIFFESIKTNNLNFQLLSAYSHGPLPKNGWEFRLQNKLNGVI